MTSGTQAPRWVELASVAAAVAVVASLRLIFGQFDLPGVLFVVVAAVFSWRVGTRAGILAALLGLGAAVGLSIALQPGLRANPAALFNRQLAVGTTTYLLLSAIWAIHTDVKLYATSACPVIITSARAKAPC